MAKIQKETWTAEWVIFFVMIALFAWVMATDFGRSKISWVRESIPQSRTTIE